MKYYFPILLILILLSCGSVQKSHEVQPSTIERYRLLSSDEIVLDAFEKSDVVIIGENHFIKEQVLFVAELIPQLHQNGVYTMYSEFTYRDDQALVDSLINAEEFDEQLAKNLLVRSGWGWVYKEYIELYRSAWKSNQTNPNSRRFRIVGLELGRDYAAIQSPEDWQKSENRMAYFRETEEAWSKRIIKESAENGEKALVYCGFNHALTFYRQPVVSNNQFIRLAGKERVGQYLYDELKENCTFLLLHAPWEPKVQDQASVNPCGGKLEAFSDQFSNLGYGFYTHESPLGQIVDTSAFHSWGYPNFKLADLCDGYIVIQPICDLSLCDAIPDFIDESNISIAREQVRVWENIDNISIEAANSMLEKEYAEHLEWFMNDKDKMGCK